jgi:hypothetical protein
VATPDRIIAPAQHAGGDGGGRADQAAHCQQQADLRPVDAQALLQLGRVNADGGLVGAVQGEHRREHEDDVPPGRAAHEPIEPLGCGSGQVTGARRHPTRR